MVRQQIKINYISNHITGLNILIKKVKPNYMLPLINTVKIQGLKQTKNERIGKAIPF